MEGAADMRRWGELCIDCLIKVFTKVGMEDLNLSLPLVCKSWNSASKHPSCWTNLYFRKLDLEVDGLTEFAGRPASFPRLLRFAISRSQGSALLLAFPSFGATVVDLLCPDLQTLMLPDWPPLEADDDTVKKDDLLELVLPRWKSLRGLYIGWMPRRLPEILRKLSVHCVELNRVSLRGAFGAEHAAAIVEHLPRLKTLIMMDSFLRREVVVAILVGCRHRLEELYVGMSWGFDVDGEILEMASTLKRFDYEGVTLGPDPGDRRIGHPVGVLGMTDSDAEEYWESQSSF